MNDRKILRNILKEALNQYLVNEQLVRTAQEFFRGLGQRSLLKNFDRNVMGVLDRGGFGLLKNLEEVKNFINTTKPSPRMVETLMAIPDTAFRKNIVGEVLASLPKNIYQDFISGNHNIVTTYLNKRFKLSPDFVSEIENVMSDNTYIPKQLGINPTSAPVAPQVSNTVGKVATKTVNPSEYPKILNSLSKMKNGFYGVCAFVIKNPIRSLIGGMIGVPVLYSLMDSLIHGLISDEQFMEGFMDRLTDDTVGNLAKLTSIPVKLSEALKKEKAKRDAKKAGTTQPTQIQNTTPAAAPATTGILEQIKASGKYNCVASAIQLINNQPVYVTNGQKYNLTWANNMLSFASNHQEVKCQ